MKCHRMVANYHSYDILKAVQRGSTSKRAEAQRRKIMKKAAATVIEEIIKDLDANQGSYKSEDEIIDLIEDKTGSEVDTYTSNHLDHNLKDVATSVYEFTVADENDDEYDIQIEADLFDDFEEQEEITADEDFDLDTYYDSAKFANTLAEQMIEQLQAWLEEFDEA